MNEIMGDITSVAMAIVGVAILAVLVSNSSNTTGVIQAASGGFSNALAVAMGGASSQRPSLYGG